VTQLELGKYWRIKSMLQKWLIMRL
jgi:hypothetical protein